MRKLSYACFLFLFLLPELFDEAKANLAGQFHRNEIKLVPNKTHYHINETLTAVFVNRYDNTIYVIKASGTSPLMVLQKWDGEDWRRVNTGRRGISGIQAVRYHELNPGGILEAQFPVDRLIENGFYITGQYRYILTFYSSPNRDERITVSSPPFRVVEYDDW